MAQHFQLTNCNLLTFNRITDNKKGFKNNKKINYIKSKEVFKLLKEHNLLQELKSYQEIRNLRNVDQLRDTLIKIDRAEISSRLFDESELPSPYNPHPGSD